MSKDLELNTADRSFRIRPTRAWLCRIGRKTPKSKGNTRGVRVFVGVGLAIGIGLIIAGGWFMKNDNPDTSTTAHLRTTPKAPSTTTGSR